MSSQVDVLNQLRAVREKWEATHAVIQDYQIAIEKSLDLEVRVMQLKKENDALRDECEEKECTIVSLRQKVPSCFIWADPDFEFNGTGGSCAGRHST